MTIRRSEDDEAIRQLQRELGRRQQFGRMPQPIGESISSLMIRRGYAALETANQRDIAWRDVAGPEIARDTRVGQLRRGVLEIVVRNSVLMQELTFRKKKLLKKISTRLAETKISDLRFRVDSIDP